MPDKTFTSATLTSSDTNTYLSHTGNAWNSWTPTLTQSGSVACTVNHATYYRSGRLIVASFRLTVTGSGTSSNAVTVSLPVTAARSTESLGSGTIYDSSAVLSYTGQADLASSTTMVFAPQGVGVSPSSLGAAGSGFTAALASGDVVTAKIMYESAS